MRILIVSGFFPPFAPIAGVRAGKFAKFLLTQGHDVHVLAARDLPFPALLPLEIPCERVHYAKWIDVNSLPKKFGQLLARQEGSGERRVGNRSTLPDGHTAKRGHIRSAFRTLSSLYTELTNWPDPQIGWLPHAIRTGSQLLERWRPDLIYATAPPLTGLLVGNRLARRFSIPWLAEFRDLWTDHPYYDAPAWRRPIERSQERAVLRSANAAVTVSDIWQQKLAQKLQKPVITILNGFDPDDYPAEPIAVSPRSADINILYTGTLYPGRRDPTPLFRAMRQLGTCARGVRAVFYGAQRETVLQLADDAGVREQVEVHDAVQYAEITRLQRSTDILLLLRWNDPSEAGVVPGKLFEYIGARRPILCLGFGEGAVPEIIRKRGLGLVSDEPDIIARQLATWIEMKDAMGKIPPLPLEGRAGFSRHEQFAKLEDFLHRLVAGSSSEMGQTPIEAHVAQPALSASNLGTRQTK